jgi:hypothetical protein
MRNPLLSAFKSIDITPTDTRRLGRLGINILIPTHVHWPLSARIALFEQNGLRLAICIADLNVMLTPSATELRQAIACGGKLPVDQVLFGWTHTHNAPTVWPWLTQDPDFTYLDFVAEKVETLAAQAAAALQPCRLRVGRTEAPSISTNRRPIYATPDGRLQVGTHGPTDIPSYVKMEGPDENELLTLQAFAKSGTPLGGIVNFAMHPTCTYSETLFSADYPGPLRAHMEEQQGGTWLFLNGAAGNLAPNSSLPGLSAQSGAERAEQFGRRLADHALRAVAQSEDVTCTDLGAQFEILSIPQRPLTSHTVETARHFLETQARKEPWTGNLSDQLYGYAYHFHHRSPAVDDWLARDIIGMWEWRRRVGERELREAVPIQTFRLGTVGLAAFPCELFTEFSRELRATSPFKHTLIAQMANGWHGYIPPAAAFEHGGYECCFALQSRLIPEAGEHMTATALRLLARLK